MKNLWWIFVGCLFTTVVYAQEEDLYAIDHIVEIKIYFKDPRWHQKLDSLKQLNKDKRLKADIIVDGVTYEDVGIRYKGNSSYFNVRKMGSNKLPFNIKLDYKGKEQSLPGGYEKLKLANVFRDPSFLREVMAYEIIRTYVPAPRANFAKVYVNDEYLGLYNNTESIEGHFFDEYFGDSDGTEFKCDPNWHIKMPENCPKGDKASLMYLGQDSTCYEGLYELDADEGWSKLIHLTKVLNETPDSLNKLLNVDYALWMLALNSVLVNLDSYTGRLCHNYYLYIDTSGYIHPLVWDMNLSFGGFRFAGLSGVPLSNQQMQELSPFIHYSDRNNKRPLITQLLSNNTYRKIYLAHVKTILEDYFVNGAYLEKAKEIQSIIDPHVKEDTNKLYTYEAFQANLEKSAKAGKQTIIGIQELMEKRTEYLLSHGVFKSPVPVVNEVKHNNIEGQIAITADIEGSEQTWLFYRSEKHKPFIQIQMNNDGQSQDQEANDKTWGVLIPNTPKVQYYVVAEGKACGTVSPTRASKDYYEFDQSVNK